MIDRVIQKIEHIRTLPDHIRLRYTIGAVAICMIFVIGIWLLTLKQGLREISPEISEGKEQTGKTFDEMGNAFPNTNSLETLKENSESLRVNNPTDDAEGFLNQEAEKKNASPAETPIPTQESQ
jgi:hypothetical protein